MGKIHNFLWQSSTPECSLFDSILISRRALQAYRFISCALMIWIFFWTVRGVLASFRFLTRWGIFWVALYFMLTCLCYFVYRDESDIKKSGPFALWKFTNVIGEMAFTLQVLIPIFYWGFVYGTEKLSEPFETWIYKTIAAHGVTAAFIWVDIAFSRLKFYKNHSVIIVIFGILYCIINFSVTKYTGEPVYKPIDWKTFKSFVLLGGALVLILAGFVLGLFITRIKSKALDKEKERIEDFYETATDA